MNEINQDKISDEFEIRTLTLKNWDVPQTFALSEIGTDKILEYGQFVSFQSHHFIDVKLCNDIKSVYKTIQEYREGQHTANRPGIHLVQTMTLVGKKSDFWNGDFGLVYFTFIQLADFSGWSYKGISEKIEQVIKDVGVKGSWAVYCSYDFCDLVLFAKNISIKQ